MGSSEEAASRPLHNAGSRQQACARGGWACGDNDSVGREGVVCDSVPSSRSQGARQRHCHSVTGLAQADFSHRCWPLREVTPAPRGWVFFQGRGRGGVGAPLRVSVCWGALSTVQGPSPTLAHGTWETRPCQNHTLPGSPSSIRAWSWASSGQSDVLLCGRRGPAGQWRETPAGVCDPLPGSPAQGRLLLTPQSWTGQGSFPAHLHPLPARWVCFLEPLPRGLLLSGSGSVGEPKGAVPEQGPGGVRPSPSPRRHWADSVRSHPVPASSCLRVFFFCFIHSPLHSFLRPSICLSVPGLPSPDLVPWALSVFSLGAPYKMAVAGGGSSGQVGSRLLSLPQGFPGGVKGVSPSGPTMPPWVLHGVSVTCPWESGLGVLVLPVTLHEENRCGFSPVFVYVSTSCSCFKKLEVGEGLELSQLLWLQGVTEPHRLGVCWPGQPLQVLTGAAARSPRPLSLLLPAPTSPPPSHITRGPANQSPCNLSGWDLCCSPSLWGRVPKVRPAPSSWR